ncbi:group 1 glycosyl transferase [Sphingopyxis fribergensis]|uniref:Group 1 glycosyl transferase n=1 Tax=Sphingopyxis fribergensis TaxID=1515612 RepID=A0A0A7PT98_9SPHN|nr:glycosyltransferase [Sphingopyxis fribergensis]AJA11292.1 group 1 glycosyl transferase [Sphingopyxis fribergensis]
MKPPRTVIVHYWLVAMRGGERVLERLLRLYPGADIITHVYDPAAVSDFIASHRIRTTFIQDLPGARKHYQKYLPLMPRALEQMDLSEYDLVISSESGPAKGVIARPDAFHLCYCHSPMRYLWDHYHQYRASAGLLSRAAMSATFPALRRWDVTSAQGIDHIAANSHFIARRIRKSWGRSADVVHPPVDVAMFQKSQSIGDHYLWVGQMTPYKRADLVADAFTRLGLPLLMVGTGELARDIARRTGRNVRIVERLDYAALRQAYADCRALVFPAEEDFGIIPVEANAAGRPVIAFGRGGVRDSIVDKQTGLFFDRQETDSLIEAVERFERWLPDFEPDAAVANAQRFAPEFFDAGITRIVSRALNSASPLSDPLARLVEAAR